MIKHEKEAKAEHLCISRLMDTLIIVFHMVSHKNVGSKPF
jgi:hypothetical protein